MSKRPNSSIFNRPLFRRPKSSVGEPSSERTLEIVDPATGLDTSLVAAPQQTVDLSSTEGPIGINFVTDPTGANLEYDPRSIQF